MDSQQAEGIMDFSQPVYSLLMASATIAALVIILWRGMRFGLPMWKLVGVVLPVLPGMLLGGRLGYVLLNLPMFQQKPSLIWQWSLSNLSLFGALLMAAAVGFLTSRCQKIDPWRMADMVTPGLAVGIFITRIGCFLNGCCYGNPTELPWGVVYPIGSRAYWSQLDKGQISFFQGTLAVHPTQLYEGLAALIILGFALWFWRIEKNSDQKNIKQPLQGNLFVTFIFLFCLFRIANSNLRVPTSTLEFLPGFPWFFYGSISLLCLLIQGWRIWRHMEKNERLQGTQ